jgi:hypothetical protein
VRKKGWFVRDPKPIVPDGSTVAPIQLSVVILNVLLMNRRLTATLQV